MNSRVIALGASVIALAVAGPAQADTGALGGVSPQLPDTDVSAKVQADVQAKVDVPAALPTKGSHGGGHANAGTDAKVNGKADAKAESHGDGAGVRVGVGGQANAGAGAGGARIHVGQEAGVRAEARTHGHLTGKAGGKAGAFTRHSAKAGARRHGHAAAKGKTRTEQSVKARPDVPAQRLTEPKGHSKALEPLRAIGREVGNPIELSLAGWLLALTGAACFAVTRLARRVQRSS